MKALRMAGWLYQRLLSPRYVRMQGLCAIDFSVAFGRSSGTIDIGPRVQIFRHGELLAPVSIGAGSFINRDAYIRAHTSIGRNVNIGPFVRFLTDSHEISDQDRRAGASIWQPIVVEDGVWIGAGSTILGGVTLHRGCIVAAGSIVTKDVAADTIVAGNPAKPIRELEQLKDRSA